MKKQMKKLSVSRETIVRLNERNLDAAHGGVSTGDYTCNTCTSLDCATSNGPFVCICA
jgi:hypothetical protein